MSLEKIKLRELAQKSIDESKMEGEDGWFEAKHMHDYYSTSLVHGAFVEATSPDVIIALLDEQEELQRLADARLDQINTDRKQALQWRDDLQAMAIERDKIKRLIHTAIKGGGTILEEVHAHHALRAYLKAAT